ncbi:FHA domain-containing protein [Streptomyces triticagri]|uniref:FHA domain-containing protein n=1 Tax=Streptomyces triticagri TaxID=2293568 RepID=A0A372MCP4_9ACTN|nr:FHA domain-containing protein [Streptomyces triticagri]RFU88275.1 FHA domain-containing protein [Streptomyces triticagri]
MPTCPNGHQSGSDDWCEVCGHRMAGAPAGAVPPPPPPPPAAGYGYPQGPPPPPGGYGYPQQEPPAQAELCPQCRTPREANAPFCEECRWNFITNTATSYQPAAPHGGVPGLNLPPGFQAQQPPGGGPQGPGGGPPQPGGGQPGGPQGGGGDYTSSRPSQMNRPAEPLQGGGPSGPQGQPGHPGQQSPPPQGGFPPPAGQPGPPAPPPGYQQQTPPAPPAGDDDWMIQPPSAQAGAQAPAPAAPGGAFPDPHGNGNGQNGGFPDPGAPNSSFPDASQGFPDTGHGFPSAQAPATWSATIGPDREYFMAMMHRSGPEASGLNLPAYSPEQQRVLEGNQITIGRRRHSTGESPDIDLSVPPEDPGVSHQHAVLVQQPDTTWAVVDQNSTNGTTVNGGEEPIQPFVPVPLQDGDRVHVGAWTTITIRRG